MKRATTRWGFPLVIPGYFALAMVQTLRGREHGWLVSLLPLLMPGLIQVVLRRMERKLLSQELQGDTLTFQLLVSGASLYLAHVLVPLDPRLDLVRVSLSLMACALGAMRAISRVEAPPGLEPTEPRAKSQDALIVVTSVWVILSVVGFIRLIFPSFVRLSPLALDAAVTFACLGSLCLLFAAEARVYLLRGLELGTLDRARGGLAILLSSVLVALGSVLFEVARSDLISESALALACVLAAATKFVPDPSAVVRGLRRTLVLLMCGGPVALLGAFVARQHPAEGTWIAFVSVPLGAFIGARADSLANPLRPERGRWIQALERSAKAALDADVERALISVLSELKRAERSASTRPEVFVTTPSEILTVDIAGYLSRKNAEFPRAIYDLASREPYRMLRAETLAGLEVRRPEIRPTLDWFRSHEVAVAVALHDPDGPVGLLTLPAGRRRSRITHEEAKLIGELGQRFSGILAVHSALSRSRSREELSRVQAEQEHKDARVLRETLENQVESRHLEAEVLVESLKAANFGTKTRDTLEALRRASDARLLVLGVPPGIDPLPWAAHLHLENETSPRSLYAFDASTALSRAESLPLTDPARGTPPLFEVPGGTLVVLFAHLLSEKQLDRIDALLREEGHLESPKRVVLAMSRAGSPSAEPTQPFAVVLSQAPRVDLPTLEERPEDLNALIIFELARISLREKGHPLGIARPLLASLVERAYPGGEAELRGLLTRAVAVAEGSILQTLGPEDTAQEDDPKRARPRPPPRQRYS
jgi:hypothetical protein